MSKGISLLPFSEPEKKTSCLGLPPVCRAENLQRSSGFALPFFGGAVTRVLSLRSHRPSFAFGLCNVYLFIYFGIRII